MGLVSLDGIPLFISRHPKSFDMPVIHKHLLINTRILTVNAWGMSFKSEWTIWIIEKHYQGTIHELHAAGLILEDNSLLVHLLYGLL